MRRALVTLLIATTALGAAPVFTNQLPIAPPGRAKPSGWMRASTEGRTRALALAEVTEVSLTQVSMQAPTRAKTRASRMRGSTPEMTRASRMRAQVTTPERPTRVSRMRDRKMRAPTRARWLMRGSRSRTNCWSGADVQRPRSVPRGCSACSPWPSALADARGEPRVRRGFSS